MKLLARIDRRRLLTSGAAATVAMIADASWSQDRWPSRPVRMIIPFPPGQATDIYGRVFAERLSALWGQSIVVDNRSGAGGIIGMEAIKGAAADGYTIGMTASGPMAINPGVYDRLAYDPVRDFTPISLAFVAPLMIIVNNDLPVHSVAELVALLRKQPGQLSYGSGGPGTSQHLACEMFKLATKTFAVHIPYRGSGPALADLMGGQVQFAIDSVSAALGNVQGGRLRAIAVTSAQRSLALPDVPTVAESGLPELRNFEAVGWGAMVGPAGMPGAIVEKITRDFETVLRDPTIVERVAATGSVVRPVSGPAFSRYIADEIRKWGAAARASNTHLG